VPDDPAEGVEPAIVSGPLLGAEAEGVAFEGSAAVERAPAATEAGAGLTGV